MQDVAYRQYQEESAGWLRAGRIRLVCDLIERFRPGSAPLELLEIGAGVGQNISALQAFGVVDASEIHPIGRRALAQCGLREVFEEPVPFELGRRYDVICALDVLEHIDDDRGAVSWIADHLRPGGILVATVPAYQALFSAHDRVLEHRRRYSRAGFTDTVSGSMTVLTAAYFNHFLFPAAVAARGAWSLKSRLLSRDGEKQPSPSSRIATSILGGILKGEVALIRHGFRPPWGLSVYCVARKTG